MRRIVLFGMPGSGKSTQGQKLAADLGCPWVSTGEILRKSKESWVQEKLKTSELFDDHIVLKLLKDALSGVGDAVIDGFPRNRAQAQMAIDEIGVTDVIELTVPEEQVIARMAERGREQDQESIAKQRVEDYKSNRRDVEEIFWQHGIEMKRVDGVGTIEEVYKRVKEAL
ncbi:nucleoside monophosphate kinase [Candidatus Saccharibacteria bacterium]|nr:nucleoside monophosphate kinase [Candidatus Saccharibacteria bacterium]